MKKLALAARSGHRCFVVAMLLPSLYGPVMLDVRAELRELSEVAFVGNSVLTTGRAITLFQKPVVNNQDLVAAITSSFGGGLDSSLDVISWNADHSMNWHLIKYDSGNYFSALLTPRGAEVRWDTLALAESGTLGGVVIMKYPEAGFEGAVFYAVVTAKPVFPLGEVFGAEDYDVVLRDFLDTAPGRAGVVVKNLATPYPQRVLLNDAGTVAFMSAFAEPEFGKPLGGIDIYRKGPGEIDEVVPTIMSEMGIAVNRSGEEEPATIAYKGFDDLAINDAGLLAFVGSTSVSADVPNPKEGLNEMVSRPVRHLVSEAGEGAFVMVAEEGKTAPGFDPSAEMIFLSGDSINPVFFNSAFFNPSYNNEGEVAFLADLYANLKGTTTVSYAAINGNNLVDAFSTDALYVGTNSEDLKLVCSKGMLANKFFNVAGTIGGDALEITNFIAPPLLNNQGQVLFIADVGNGAVGSVVGRGLLLYDPLLESETKTVAVADLREWTDDTESFEIFRVTEEYALDNFGNVAFKASIAATASGVTFDGLYYRPFLGALQTVVQVGDTVEAGGSVRTVEAIDFQGGSTASGRPVGMTDNGGIVFGLSFDDETSGIFQIPSKLPTIDFEFVGLYEPEPANWHAGVSNWRDKVNGLEASTLPGDGSGESVVIDGFDVVLDGRAVELKSINATGSLTVENNLSLSTASSSIENLSLGADLTLGGSLALTGNNNSWGSGMISGSGPVIVREGGVLAFQSPAEAIHLKMRLTAESGSRLILSSGILDLNKGAGTIQIDSPNGILELQSGTLVDGDTGSLDPVVRSEGKILKTTDASVTVDAYLETTKEGSIVVEEGLLEFTNPVILAGPVEIKSGARLKASLGPLILGDLSGTGMTISGEGTFEKGIGPILLSGGGTVTLKLEDPEGGFEIGDDVNISGDDETLLVNGHFRKTGTGESTIAAAVRLEPPGESATDRSATIEVDGGILELTKSVQAKGGKLVVNGGELVLLGEVSVTDDLLIEGEGLFEVGVGGELAGFPGVEAQLDSIENKLEGMGLVLTGGGIRGSPGPVEIDRLLSDGTTIKVFDVTSPTLVLNNSGIFRADSGEISGSIVRNGGSFSGSRMMTLGGGESPLVLKQTLITNQTNGTIEMKGAVNGPVSGYSEIRNNGTLVLTNALVTPGGGGVLVQNQDGGLISFVGDVKVDGGSRTILNEGTLQVNTDADVTLRSVDLWNMDIIPLSEGLWGLAGGRYEVHNGSLDLVPLGENEVVPIHILGRDSFVEMIGPDSSINNLPIVAGRFEAFGRIDIEDLDFFVTGESGIFVVSGEMRLGPGSSLSAKTFRIEEAGTVFLQTAGSLPVTLENKGSVVIGSSPGVATIEGDYEQFETGSLEIELGGLEAGSDYDQLIVGGTATFLEGSKITITLIDPNPDDGVDEVFVPRTGDSFSFLVALDIELPSGMTLGDFVEFTNLPAGVDFNLDLAIVDGMTEIVITADSTLTPPLGPRIISHPATQMASAGGPVTFSVGADSADAFTYQWRLNGVDITGATDATYTVPFAQTTNSGDYSVVVTADGVSAASKVAMLEVSAPPPNDARLLNLSTRAVSLTGNNVLIPGFVIEGTGTKNLLIRAVGASLRAEPFNIATALEDPQMTLKQWTGSAFEDVEANNDWETNSNAAEITQAMINLGAFALTDSRDAALLTDLDAGRYTVIAGGVGDLTGVAIVELFDGDGESATTVLTNISNRGFVGTGASIMIPGVTVSSEGPKTFLIRAVGPALGQEPFNLIGVIEDPKMTVFSGSTPILSNDNWGDSADAANTAAVAALLGAFPLPEGSKDAAMVVTLPPGGYTIQAAGVNGATGTAIVEVYVVE